MLESLHKLTSAASPSLLKRLNPFSHQSPPKFEFLALTEGEDEPIEFYYGVTDGHLDALESRLQTIYPPTFDINRVDLDPVTKIVTPVEYSRDEFQERASQDRLYHDYNTDQTDQQTSQSNGPEGLSTQTDSIEINDSDIPLVHESEVPSDKPLTALSQPVATDGGHVLARPPISETSPIGVRWRSVGDRKRDWMTPLASYTNATAPSTSEQGRSPLRPLVDLLTEAREPTAFQVTFQRKSDWDSTATSRQADLLAMRDTRLQKITSYLFSSDWDRSPDELSGDAERRYELIDDAATRSSFTVNIRAVSVPAEDEPTAHKSTIQTMCSALDSVDGEFYSIQGQRLREKGIRQSTKEKNARKALTRLANRTITTGSGTTRPDIVVSGDELANFMLTPAAGDLSVEGTRGTRAEQQSRNPLPRPHQDLMADFRNGMAIGRALDETGDPEAIPTRLPPNLLPTHYGRFGTTGSGKSKALINDMLSLYEDTDGPTILIDPKGDGMAENYMRAHATRFGVDDLEENVVHFPLPTVLPGFSFFNLEPAMENGRRRKDAVQRKADHYEEILKLVMGAERYERATVAPGLIKTLIKALFDEEHGRENGQYRESENYFAHRQLEHTVDQLWEAGPPQPDLGAAPQSNDEEVIRSLRRQLQADSSTFSNVMGGVGNRLSYISQDTHLRRIFNNTENQFDFRDVLDDQSVILFDLGDLRDEAARIMTGLILTNLEDALQEQNQDASKRSEDYVVNLLIDEAATVAVSDIMNSLLEQGRSFRLSVGLSMQFPEQMEAEGGRKAYLNVLNNIGSPLVGKINVDRELAQAMAHEDMDTEEFANRIRSLPRGEWIANLPSPRFGETGPYPFSLDPLPIPAGHPESDQPLTEREEARFNEALTEIHDHADETFGVAPTETPSTETPAELSEVLDVADGELDVALAKVVRSVQFRTDDRADNGWVPVETVDDELRRLFEDTDADAPAYEDLSTIRQRSRYLETTVDIESDDLVIRLTDDGEAVATPDTGAVQSAGSHKHDAALEQIEEELTALGFTVSILTQDGREKPDARATHPDFSGTFAIEIETTTPENPAKVLVNLRKAQNADEFPLFVVRPGKSETDWAERVEGILNPPVRGLETGETRFYTTDANITFNGGATEKGGVTAIRPATEADSTQTIWSEENDDLVLRDATGTERLRLSSLEDVSKGRVPATYSYDHAAEEYIVYEHGTQHIYESKEAFESDWVRIKRPFVPEMELETAGADQLEYAIMILSSDGDIAVYADGRTYPVDALMEVITAREKTAEGRSEALQQAHPPEIGEIADEPEAVVSRFADRYLVEASDSRATAADVYETYKQWAEEHDISPDSKSWFARRLSNQLSFERTTEREDGKPVRYYEGIALNEAGTAKR